MLLFNRFPVIPSSLRTPQVINSNIEIVPINDVNIEVSWVEPKGLVSLKPYKYYVYMSNSDNISNATEIESNGVLVSPELGVEVTSINLSKELFKEYRYINVLSVSQKSQKTAISSVSHSMPKYADFIYLNFEDDPLTTMTIQWHTLNDLNPDGAVLYREEDSSDEWLSVTGSVRDMPVTDNNRKIHWTKLEGLNPETGYEFKFNGDTLGAQYKFKTLPANLEGGKEIRIASSSDAHGTPDTNILTLSKCMGGTVPEGFDADLIVGVGDYTYDDGEVGLSYTQLWINLLNVFTQSFINSEGYLIPFIPAIGNHDTLRQKNSSILAPGNAPNFESLFAFPTQPLVDGIQYPFYGHLEFGDYLQLMVLDTSWGSQSHWSELTPWIQSKIRPDIKHILPVCHVPHYSYRMGTESKDTSRIQAWCPIFENAGVNVMLEGHNHNYARTYEIKNDTIVPDNSGGIKFVGQGTWRYVRPHNNLQEDGTIANPPVYFEDYKFSNYNTHNARHFHGIILTEDKIKVQAIRYSGEVFHEFERGVQNDL